MINYFFEDIEKIKFIDKTIKDWLNFVINENGKKVGSLNYIFCKDQYLIEINKKYLNHNYFTDIITFNYNDNDIISGDIFISIDTVNRNAVFYHVDFKNELLRVMVHGILHLIGFDDISAELKEEMTGKENESIEIFYSRFDKL